MSTVGAPSLYTAARVATKAAQPTIPASRRASEAMVSAARAWTSRRTCRRGHMTVAQS